jgi:hypothetical protein
MPQLFPRAANTLPLVSLVGVLGGGLLVVLLGWYYLSPKYYEVGYMPEQPVEYSHALHAGQLGMDCRYCHNLVEQSPHANVPSTQTCMNCHSQVQTQSAKLLPVRESWATGTPIQWVKVNHIPDYAQFSHAAHVNVGVGCESCHGRIDEMPVVYQESPMSMGWCLECHRAPEDHLRDPALVTVMGYLETMTEADVEANRERIAAEGIKPPENCSACHY